MRKWSEVLADLQIIVDKVQELMQFEIRILLMGTEEYYYYQIAK